MLLVPVLIIYTKLHSLQPIFEGFFVLFFGYFFKFLGYLGFLAFDVLMVTEVLFDPVKKPKIRDGADGELW